MGILDTMFYDSLNNALSFKKVGAQLIARQLARQGVTLSQEQLESIEAQLENAEGDSQIITIDELILENESQLDEVIQLDSHDDIDEILTEIKEKITDAVPDITSELADKVLEQLHYDAPRMLEEHREGRETFASQVYQKWGTALDLLEMLKVIAEEVGVAFNKEFRPRAVEESNFVFEVLTGLHARACQVASEVLALLRAGFADGAHARWRTLHEIAVTALFIQQSGNATAERYLLHHHIESYKAALQYQAHCARLGQEPMSEKEMEDIRTAYRDLIDRFGPEYKENYGWAASILGNKKPNFANIEQETALEHWRPYYKLASHNVHANPKGMLYRLGLYPEHTSLLLIGPSDAGLADPGHGAAISLSLITTALLTIEPNVDRIVICKVMMELTNRIGNAFLAAHEKDC